jgi:hypothetical protein
LEDEAGIFAELLAEPAELVGALVFGAFGELGAYFQGRVGLDDEGRVFVFLFDELVPGVAQFP